MTLVLVGVTLGPVNTASQLPVTTSNGKSFFDQAITDLTTIAGKITTTITDAGTADTDMATVVTNINTTVTDATTADNAVATVVTDTTTTDNDNGTSLTDFDLVATTVSNGIVALLNTAGGGPLTYSTLTHSYSGNCGTSSTISQAQGNALITLLNTLGAALVAAKTASATAKTDAATAKTNTATTKTDATTAQTNANTTKTATAQAKTDANALTTGTTTGTVSTDITNGEAVLASNVVVKTDSTVCASVSTLNGALQAALGLIQSNSILPP